MYHYCHKSCSTSECLPTFLPYLSRIRKGVTSPKSRSNQLLLKCLTANMMRFDVLCLVIALFCFGTLAVAQNGQLLPGSADFLALIAYVLWAHFAW